MNDTTSLEPQDRADAALRALLAQSDPEAGVPSDVPPDLLERVLDAAHADAAPAPGTPGAQPAGHPHPTFLRRHWQGVLLAAATITTLALAAGTILPGLAGGSGDSDSLAAGTARSAEVELTDTGTAEGPVAAEAPAADSEVLGQGPDLAANESGAGTATADSDEATEPALVRSGSLLVGTEDVGAARDAFVATVLGMGGRITSETVITEGSPAAQPYAAEDYAASYPYPWYPSGPGIWLTVQVPVESYDAAIDAARSAGEVVRMQQSSYDVGAQISDVDARISALEASLERLTALMGRAEDVADVIALEQAIAQRQSELDGLRAQQRDLANQTAMSQIGLTLMSPQDARDSVNPQPEAPSWWESFLEGLGQFWAWLGSALLIVSPLVLAGAIIWWVRRRRKGSPSGDGQPDGDQPPDASGPA